MILTNWVIVNSDNTVIIKIDLLFLVQEILSSICMILVNILALRDVFLVYYNFFAFFNLSHCSG